MIPIIDTSLASWSRSWHELGAARADAALHERLIACWSEPHRHYHTLQHLGECLMQLEAARALAQHPAQIAPALWFHDACYDPRRDDNEERSASWARASAVQAGLPNELADRLHALVMATRHETLPADPDAQLTADVDLAVLGAEPGRFDEYEGQVRAEYAHLNEREYGRGRRLVLERFLQRPHIYGTQHFHQALESRARENLNRSMARLAACETA